MIPYSNFQYFYILALVLLPAVILGITGKRVKYYGLLASLFIIYLLFHLSKIEILSIIAFYVIEVCLIYIFLWITRKVKNKWILWVFILLSICPLIITKFSIVSPIKGFGFLGISYLTFKSLQLIIEIHSGLIKELTFIDLSYFILFFPTLSSGPIDRWRRFNKEINSTIQRKEYLEYLGGGLCKIVQGIGYKFIAGYLINTYILEKIPEVYSFINTLKYMYAYSFYLFFDFAGYSLMAIGVSNILGVRTPKNFNLPFISRNIKDFWNRWHITLSFWFRDYIYTQYVFNALKSKWFKNKYIASYTGYLLTMAIMGVWHGIEMHYIVYGLYHGTLIILTDMSERIKGYRNIKDKPWFIAISTFATFNLICFGFLIFSGRLFK